MYVRGMKAYGGTEVKLLSYLTLPFDAGGRFHIPATLHLRRRSPLPTEQEKEWAPKPVWTLGHFEEEIDVLSLIRNEPRSIGCPAYSPVTLATELTRVFIMYTLYILYILHILYIIHIIYIYIYIYIYETKYNK